MSEAIIAALQKIGAQLAAKAATHKDKQGHHSTLIIIILIPVVIFIVLLSLVQYIFTTPIRLLTRLFGLSETDISMCSDLQLEFGYYQELSVHSGDYTDEKKQNFDDITFTANGINVKYFNQLDDKWRHLAYGSDEIGTHGCGPTALAMVASTLTGREYTPVNVAQWAVDFGYYAEGNGSNHTLIPDYITSLGINVKPVDKKQDTDTAQEVASALSSGKLVIAIMGKGHFTDSGHFLVLRGITDSGRILIADPASVNRTQQDWSLEMIVNEAKTSAGGGGPFWIFN